MKTLLNQIVDLGGALVRRVAPAACVLTLCAAATAQPCDPGGGLGSPGPDVIVGVLTGVENYGTSGGYYAYSIGTTSCNIGTSNLLWIASNTQHPVIAQNLYRLEHGRFEHIGMSWLKHGFTALQQNSCGCGCDSSGTGSALGVGCSDPYSASLNGNNNSLGARSEVTDPANGIFIYPRVLNPVNQNLTWRRLRVHGSDIDPAQRPTAQYFVEGHYVTPDDATAGNQHNNASYRRVTIGTNPSTFPITLVDTTMRQRPGIQAWQDFDPTVTLVPILTPDNGRLILGYKVSDNGDGTYHYEYALYNMNSTRSIGSFSLPLPAGITLSNVGFHDVEYHSGEPYDGTDWPGVQAPGSISWSTTPHGTNPNANALRWGSVYNFRFDANSAPVSGSQATIGFFVPGSPATTSAPVLVPSGDFTDPVQGLTCTNLGQDVQLSWTNASAGYSSLQVRRDGVALATLSGSATGYFDATPGVGEHTYQVIAEENGVPSGPVPCLVEVLAPLAFSYPDGFTALLAPFGESRTVQITEQHGGVLQAGSPLLFYDAGSGYLATPLSALGGGLHAMFLPALPCGSEVLVYVQAETTAGTVVTDPPDGAADPVRLTVATDLYDHFDDMESDTGWSAGAPGDNATSGTWVRVDPVGTAAQPEDDHTPAPGVTCWVTGQGAVGGAIGTVDVDGGSTTLVSPVYDMSARVNPYVSYWRWYSNDEGAAPNADIFEVEITSNGSTWIDVETVGPTGLEASGGWFFHEFRVLDLIPLTASVRLRFRASDLGSGSIVEAALDDFRIRDVECGNDCNQNGMDDAQDLALGTSQDCNGNAIPDECDIAAGTSADANTNGVPDSCEGPQFVRGDCNADGSLDISDAVKGLGILFAGKGPAACQDACDVNDDGAHNIADPTYFLGSIFGQGPLPPAPWGACGLDPTADAFGCGAFSSCP